MADVKWIKISTDIFDNRKIRQIESLPDGAGIVVVWLKMLCLAGSVNDNGLIYITKEIPYTEQMLSTQFNCTPALLNLSLKTFQEFGMIDIIDSIVHISNWEKYQNVDRLTEIREYNRLAQQKCRAKRKKLQAVNDKSMTSQRCHETDIDIDKEIDKDIDKTKYRKPSKVRFFENDELNNEFHEYIKYRKQMKRPLSERGITLAISTIKKLAGDDPQKGIAIIDQTIERGWVGLFDIKEDDTKRKKNGFHNYDERRDNNLDSDVMDRFNQMVGG